MNYKYVYTAYGSSTTFEYHISPINLKDILVNAQDRNYNHEVFDLIGIEPDEFRVKDLKTLDNWFESNQSTICKEELLKA